MLNRPTVLAASNVAAACCSGYSCFFRVADITSARMLLLVDCRAEPLSRGLSDHVYIFGDWKQFQCKVTFCRATSMRFPRMHLSSPAVAAADAPYIRSTDVNDLDVLTAKQSIVRYNRDVIVDWKVSWIGENSCSMTNFLDSLLIVFNELISKKECRIRRT